MESDACFKNLTLHVQRIAFDDDGIRVLFHEDMLNELEKVSKHRWDPARRTIEGLMTRRPGGGPQPFTRVQMFAGYAIADIMYEAGRDARDKLKMFIESVSSGLGPAAAIDIGQGIDIALAAARCSAWELARDLRPGVDSQAGAPPEPEAEAEAAP